MPPPGQPKGGKTLLIAGIVALAVVVVAVVIVVAVVAGRSKSSTTTDTTVDTTPAASAHPTTTTTRPSTATTRPHTVTLRLTDANNGGSITVAKGSTIIVVLGSTYWMFPNPPNGAVLQQEGGVVTAPAPIWTCVPGAGCGTVTVTFKVVGDGTTYVSASRTTCGEALKCTGNAGTYAVAVVVSG